MKPSKPPGWVLALLMTAASVAGAGTIPLTGLGVEKVHQDWGKPGIDSSIDGKPLSVGGQKFEAGLGTHAGSVLWIDTGGRGEKFTASVGVDDEVRKDNKAKNYGVEFRVLGDRKTLYKSGRMRVGDAAKKVDVDLHGVKTVVLVVTSFGGQITDGHADWADAKIEFGGAAPVAIDPPAETTEILTPPPPATPRINSAKVVGVRPGHPLLFHVAATGDRPMTFTADGLPDGVSLDGATGQLSGSVRTAGSYAVRLRAVNAKGKADQTLKIEAGDKIALTPPMGWNSWNCFAGAVSDQKVRAAADAMVSSGLIDHGWTYINIDDCWEVRANRPEAERRAPDGHILTNAKFPDMKALADYVHSKGLRVGLYSSPGTSTCGGFTASYKFEAADASRYAQWGFDYLKYDWCSYANVANGIKKGPNPPTPLEIDKKPYQVMGGELAKQNRDILFSFCQYGMGDVWKWGDATGGNCWRTTDDINDSWASMSGIGFSQNGHETFAGPGHWNDPDMLVVGKVGWGPALHPTKLTPNEQYTHISLWALLDAPLLIGCDMTQMDDFTRGLLTNDEVIAVNQDPLGRQASRVQQNEDETEVWVKDLSDGTKVAGLFNRGEMSGTVTVKWSDLGLTGKQTVRDLWRQKDVAIDEAGFTAPVNRHGVVLVKVSALK